MTNFCYNYWSIKYFLNK